jgi:Acetoacetate decarboxylase (ADC)
VPLNGVNVRGGLGHVGTLRPGHGDSSWPAMPSAVLQLTLETSAEACRQLLPPALHPVNPGVLVVTAYDLKDPAAGTSFRLVEVGIQCRAGARARRYLLGAAIDDPEKGAQLEEGWGYMTKLASISVERRYERIDLTVSDGPTVLRASLLKPEPVVPSAILYVAGLRPMVHDEQPWIAQFERSFEISRADRGRPDVSAFDAQWWGDGAADGLRATLPISGSFAQATVTLNPVRFLIEPGRPRSADTRRLTDVVG